MTTFFYSYKVCLIVLYISGSFYVIETVDNVDSPLECVTLSRLITNSSILSDNKNKKWSF